MNIEFAHFKYEKNVRKIMYDNSNGNNKYLKITFKYLK